MRKLLTFTRLYCVVAVYLNRESRSCKNQFATTIEGARFVIGLATVGVPAMGPTTSVPDLANSAAALLDMERRVAEDLL